MKKRIILLLCASFFVLSLKAQPTIDLGLKGGANFCKISFDLEDYSSETALKTHFGAFGRFGWNRVFIQPEVYFSGKGGDVKSVSNVVTSFDFKTVDIPVLLGVKLIKGKVFDLHVVGGPVFSGITKKHVDDKGIFEKQYYEDHYFGIQYGVGVDVLFFTFDARMENGLNQFYNQLSSDMKSNTFMLSVGFKLL